MAIIEILISVGIIAGIVALFALDFLATDAVRELEDRIRSRWRRNRRKNKDQ